MKKSKFSYGICLVILVLLYGLLVSCQKQASTPEEMNQPGQSLQEDSLESSQGKEELNNGHNAVEDSVTEEMQFEEDTSEKQMGLQQDETEKTVRFEVEPGDYVSEILSRLVIMGWGENEEELLRQMETLTVDSERYELWSRISNWEERAFVAEGYIAPGVYEWSEEATITEVLEQLLSSWDTILTADMVAQAAEQGYSIDDVLIMASIVEWESSFDPNQIVKPRVAAVVRNRIESETPLQMDVTIFYLQEALEPLKNPQEYEEAYDTYLRSTLPAGPIGSPSIESIEAVLSPADTQDLFFVYDEDGNYYFAEDYEQHLENCEIAGIY